MRVHDKGRVFVTTMPIKRGLFPLADTMWARQTEEPYRQGSGIVVRVWIATGVAFGWWGPARDVDETQALLEGLAGPRRWGGGGGAEVDAALLPIREGEYVRGGGRIIVRTNPPIDRRAVVVLVVLWALAVSFLPA